MGSLVNVLRLRADKPRRALPPVQDETTLRSFGASRAAFGQLLKRGVTAVVVSGMAIAGFSAFTASTATGAGIAFADQGIAIASIPAVEAAARTTSVTDLAQERNERLAADSAAVTTTLELAAAEARRSALGSDAAAIAEEITRLKNLSKFLWPTAGGISSPYGMRLHPILGYYRMHDGDDIGGKCGQPIYAAQSGVVIKAAMGYNGGSGNNVRINHGDINGTEVQTSYLHMVSYVVSVGQKVDQGDLIGHVGSTGLSTACHLHFTLYENSRSVDPSKYIGWSREAAAKDVKSEEASTEKASKVEASTEVLPQP